MKVYFTSSEGLADKKIYFTKSEGLAKCDVNWQGLQEEYGRTVRWAVTTGRVSDFALIRDLVLARIVAAGPDARD